MCLRADELLTVRMMLWSWRMWVMETNRWCHISTPASFNDFNFVWWHVWNITGDSISMTWFFTKDVSYLKMCLKQVKLLVKPIFCSQHQFVTVHPWQTHKHQLQHLSHYKATVKSSQRIHLRFSNKHVKFYFSVVMHYKRCGLSGFRLLGHIDSFNRNMCWIKAANFMTLCFAVSFLTLS